MKTPITGLLIILCALYASGQPSEGHSERLSDLVDEAIVRNPEIIAAIHEMGRASAVISQESAVDDPMLIYEREEMPGFQWNNPMMYRIGLMQTMRFPTKLGKSGDIAEINAEHAHHDHLEKVNEVIFRVRSAFVDLWFAQQSLLLTRETSVLLRQIAETARTRYGAGQAGQQDVLKSQVELTRTRAALVELRNIELSAKATLMSLTNRDPADTIGIALLPDIVPFNASLDSLERAALRNRPLLTHDSLTVQERETMVALAENEYLPDLLFGVEYVNWPDAHQDAWTVRAGISLPIAPWTLGKSAGRVEEAKADLSRSRSSLVASRNMVIEDVTNSYLMAASAWKRYSLFDESLLPQSKQAFEATVVGYQTGREDFLMLIDSYRTLVEISEEFLMIRRELEKAVAELNFTVGVSGIGPNDDERGQE